ncbi:nuclear transport factor 2 family protein [bacterium]|nr:nuclear transport factor 2 family protein [bacterium]
MSPEEAGALRHLQDDREVRDVVLRYARGVDRRDLDLVRACFEPGAPYAGSLATGTVEDALRSLADALGRWDATMHFVGNQLVELHGDRASCESYAIAFHRRERGDDSAELVVGIRYEDELARGPAGWRIARRSARALWSRGDATAPQRG